jgi:hypothetical protein
MYSVYWTAINHAQSGGGEILKGGLRNKMVMYLVF